MVPDNEHLHLRQAVRIGQHALRGGRHIARDQYIIFSRGHQCGKAAIAHAGQDRRKQPQTAAGEVQRQVLRDKDDLRAAALRRSQDRLAAVALLLRQEQPPYLHPRHELRGPVAVVRIQMRQNEAVDGRFTAHAQLARGGFAGSLSALAAAVHHKCRAAAPQNGAGALPDVQRRHGDGVRLPQGRAEDRCR